MFVFDLSEFTNNLTQPKFIELCNDHGYHKIGYKYYPTSLKADGLKDIIGAPIASFQDENYFAYLVEYKQTFIRAELQTISEALYLYVAGPDTATVEATIAEFIDLIPPKTPVAENEVRYQFYMLTPQGPTYVSRTLGVPNWEDIKENYSGYTQTAIDELMNLAPEGGIDGGKIILLHGQPGLGKSYAIRALSKKFNEWAKSIYITDPEDFFDKPTYMFNVFLHSDYSDTGMWNFVIAEDSDEFIRADAKDRTGQGLSRLLNLSDGLIGQGLKILILLTTNEPLNNLHPAVIRPGRCLADIEFKPFTTDEAKLWLKNRELDPDLIKHSKLEHSLAELYDIQRNNKQIKNKKEDKNTGLYL